MKVPKHLAPPERKWFKDIATEYAIGDAGGLTLLTLAAEAKQRCREATAIVSREGVTILDRFGKPQQHPALRAELAARTQLMAALRELHLDLEPLRPVGRPTSPVGVTEVY